MLLEKDDEKSWMIDKEEIDVELVKKASNQVEKNGIMQMGLHCLVEIND